MSAPTRILFQCLVCKTLTLTLPFVVASLAHHVQQSLSCTAFCSCPLPTVTTTRGLG